MNFHEILGRFRGIALIDIFGTFIIAEIIIRYINRNNKYRIGLLRLKGYLFFLNLALFTHLLFNIETPITKLYLQ